jgi:hyaluronoglucosaminidase
VTTFAVLFDDIPSRLDFNQDRKHFSQSLARAEACWLQEIQAKQPGQWKDVEWWICPSYYTPDPWLARVYGRFEPDFLEILGEYLPENVACFWTGPSVVPKGITVSHVQKIAQRIKHRLLLWDNYPVNDLSMRDELHIGPLQGRDPKLPRVAYGYLNNPLLQETLGFIPLATCFDYAADPAHYHPELSWSKVISELFGPASLPHWRALRGFCEGHRRAKKSKQPLRLSPSTRRELKAAVNYVREHRLQKWAREIRPWQELLERELL